MLELDMNVKCEALRAQPVFSQLNDSDLDVLATLLKQKEYQPGTVIVNEGDLVDSVYLIIDGEAAVQHVSIKPDGTRHAEPIATLYPGQAIGLNETGFFSISGVRTATVAAKTPLTVFYLSVAAFNGFALANSHVNELMHKQARSMLSLKN